MVEDNKCGNLAPKPSNWVQLILFAQDYFKFMNHHHLGKPNLQIKVVSIE
jgi:hypothetical protein